MTNSMIILGSEPALPPENRHEKKKDQRKGVNYGQKVGPKGILLRQGLLRESESRRRASLRQSWWVPGNFVYRLQVIHPPYRRFSRSTSTKPMKIKPASRNC
jgi:hypothetical protein